MTLTSTRAALKLKQSSLLILAWVKFVGGCPSPSLGFLARLPRESYPRVYTPLSYVFLLYSCYVPNLPVAQELPEK